MGLNKPLEVLVYYLNCRIVGFGHQDEFPMVNALVCITILITTQKEHILDNNSHEFHIFCVVIMPKILN